MSNTDRQDSRFVLRDRGQYRFEFQLEVDLLNSLARCITKSKSRPVSDLRGELPALPDGLRPKGDERLPVGDDFILFGGDCRISAAANGVGVAGVDVCPRCAFLLATWTDDLKSGSSLTRQTPSGS